jgi:hypothetical protein
MKILSKIVSVFAPTEAMVESRTLVYFPDGSIIPTDWSKVISIPSFNNLQNLAVDKVKNFAISTGLYVNEHKAVQIIAIFIPTLTKTCRGLVWLYSIPKLEFNYRTVFEIMNVFFNVILLGLSLICYTRHDGTTFGFMTQDVLGFITAVVSFKWYTAYVGQNMLGIETAMRLRGAGSTLALSPPWVSGYIANDTHRGVTRILEPNIIYRALEFTPLFNTKLLEDVFAFHMRFKFLQFGG